MDKRLRYACIGAGGIANKKHLNEYSRLPDVNIVAICDSNIDAAKKLSEKFSIPNVYSDYNRLFKEVSLDIVSVCTPNYLHAPITISALEKGINVHCEKPLALNADEVQKIMAAKNKYGGKVMVALDNRFSSESSFVKHSIEQGLLGEIYHAKCGWRRRNGIPGKGVWFTDKQLSGGGALIDLGVHYIDLVMSFMGYPQVNSVFGASYTKFDHCNNRLRQGYKSYGDGKFDVEDMAVGFIRTTENATIDFEFSWASNIEKECKFYELLGTKGGISYYNGELNIYSEMFDTSINISPEMGKTSKPMNEFEHFTNCVRIGSEPEASPEQAFKLMQIIDAIYLSGVTKKEVVLNSNSKAEIV